MTLTARILRLLGFWSRLVVNLLYHTPQNPVLARAPTIQKLQPPPEITCGCERGLRATPLQRCSGTILLLLLAVAFSSRKLGSGEGFLSMPVAVNAVEFA